MSKTKLQKQIIKVGNNEKKTVVIEKSGTYVIELIGKGAEVKIVGGVVGKSNDNLSIQTMQHHKAPNTTSNLLIKSALFDSSTFTYKGLIKIEKKAKGANAYQRNENLLLSNSAFVECRPDLEIEANDVRCTHGATVGEIDSDQLFYLQSRGLSKKQSEELIVEGFMKNVRGIIS